MTIVCQTCGLENSGYIQGSLGTYRFSLCGCFVPTDEVVEGQKIYKTVGQMARELGMLPENRDDE